MKSLSRWLAGMEAKVLPAESKYERLRREWAKKRRQERLAFIAHVPPDLRAAVVAVWNDPDHSEGETFSSWVMWPFDHRQPIPAGFEFPRALVEFMVRPGRPFFMGHHCERCGLSVPIYLLGADGFPPLSDLKVFPTCPACGGKTSSTGRRVDR